MDKPTKIIIDCSSGEVSEVLLTEEEIIEIKKQQEIAKKELAQLEAQATEQELNKQSAINKIQNQLGLTELEIEALLKNIT